MTKRLLHYNARLRDTARCLRRNMTESEGALWFRLRGKQLLGVQFYRQKPIGDYVVDFYAPKARLVIEVDGSQHAQEEYARRDKGRDNYLTELGIKVLRFNSRDVLKDTGSVVELIYSAMKDRLDQKSP